jgi:TRAP transporter TAXI family solute receptor
MKRRSTFAVIAVALGLVGLALGAVFVARMPRTFTLAVGPEGLESHRYAEILARAAEDARERVRFRIIPTVGAAQSARLLEENMAQLAMIRSDFDLPANGQSLIVTARRFAVVIAPQMRRGGLQTFADLKGKRIAVVRMTDPNLPLARRMLEVAEISDADATLIETELADLPEAMASGKVDAAIAVVVPSAPAVAQTMAALGRRLPLGFRLLPVPSAEAMASRMIGVETAELPAGIFGAGRPAEEIQTIAVTYRVMARAGMPKSVAGDVARTIYDQRARMARQAPVAFTAEAPDAKTGARIPTHPGAAAFFDGESSTFLERNGEMLLMLLWAGTLVGSAASGLIAWASRKEHGDGAPLIDEIIALTTEARRSPAGGLPAIEGRIDEIVGELARGRARGWASAEAVESASLALEHLRAVVEARRSA